MKKQGLLRSFLIMILWGYSLNINAFELKQDATNTIFSESELNKLLNIRPFETAISLKASQRMVDIFSEYFKNQNIPPEKVSKLAECVAGLTMTQVTTTPAFHKKLAKPEQLMSDYVIGVNIMFCKKALSIADDESSAAATPAESSASKDPDIMSVSDLILDFSDYYGKVVTVKGTIYYNDTGSYLYQGNKKGTSFIFINNERLSRESKAYLMNCGMMCEVTMKIRPSKEESEYIKTAYALLVVR